jgi:nitrite reductase/ring-hydroxylating ferredoxin subunit
MAMLLSDADVIERVFDHIDQKTTDLGDDGWQEPVANYTSAERLATELELLRRLPIPYCPSAALPEAGSYVARTAAGTPLLVVRGDDGAVRAFRNACRHRGMRLADGEGCKRVFTCTYHGWTYRLDGRLQYIPHEHGFPGFDKSTHGLVPVSAIERHGLVWVTQDEPVGDGALADMVDLFGPGQRIFDSKERADDINWKLNAEATIEGYHIRTTHPETFFPYGFDNLNVVENFGPNSRITYPFRRIEKLRNLPAERRCIDGLVTYVYQLFPNVTVAVLSNHTTLSIAEPETPTRTRFVTYRLTNRGDDGSAAAGERAKRDAAFVADSGGKEDRDVIRAIQAGIPSGANAHFTFGRFEKAIVHFHRHLDEALARLG